MIGLRLQHVRHERDDERLRDRLAVANRQGSVGVGFVTLGFGHEEVTRGLPHDVENARIERLAMALEERSSLMCLDDLDHLRPHAAEVAVPEDVGRTADEEHRKGA
jgi:hypothetical protein